MSLLRRGISIPTLVLSVLLAAGAGRGFAEEGEPPWREPAPPGPRIARIDIVGSITYTPEALRHRLGTRVGGPYGPALLDNDLRRLLDTGRYRSVRWSDPVREGDEVALTLTVEERPLLDEIEYLARKGEGEDAEWVKDKHTLGREVVKKEARLVGILGRASERYVESRAWRLSRVLEDRYRERGHFLAKVGYETETLEKKSPQGLPRVKLVFRIDEGEPAPIKRLGGVRGRFVGNRVYSDAQLAKLLAQLLERQGAGVSFDRLKFERAFRTMETVLYRDRGYLDVRIRLARLVLFTDARPEKRKKQHWLVPHIEIEEGPVYRVGRIGLKIEEPEGDTPIEVKREEIMSVITLKAEPGGRARPAEEFAELYRVPLKEGGVYSERTLELARRRVAKLLGRSGRIGSSVRTRRILPEEGSTVDVEFVVKPSRRYRVRNWDVRGNHKTKPWVFLRELKYAGIEPATKTEDGKVIPGDIIDTRKLDLAVRNIRYTNLVKPEIDEAARRIVRPDVNIRPLNLDPKRGLADLAVDVHEGETGMLQIGLSVSSNDVLVGFVQFSQRNFDILGWPRSATNWTNAFTGAGQNFTLNASFGTGTVSKSIIASFEEPYFLGLPVRLGVNYFDTGRRYREYDIERAGGGVSLTRSWSLHPFKRRKLWARVGLKYEDVSLDVESTAPADFLAEDGNADLYRGTVGIGYDSRDSRLLPSRGWHVGLYHDVVGGQFLPGDKDFDKTRFDLKKHFRLGANMADSPHILQFSAKLHHLRAGGTEVPFYERFYAGGVGSLRGFDYRSVGPKDPATGAEVGGEYRLLETIEYTFPMSEDGVLRGVFFYDAGNVWATGDDFDFGDQKQSVGVGILLYPPGWPFPISFDWGWIINKEPEDDSRRFSFTMGTMFF